MDDPPEQDWRRPAARRFLVAALIIIIGLAIALPSEGTRMVIGWSIAGVGAVVALSLAFLEVGYAEERDRVREAKRRR